MSFGSLANDALVATAAEPLGLVCSLIQVLDETVVRRLTALRAVHAGTVMYGGRVLLFPGVIAHGKILSGARDAAARRDLLL